MQINVLSEMYIKELKTVEFMFSKIHVDIRASRAS